MKKTARVVLLIGCFLLSVSGTIRADDVFPDFGRGVPRSIFWHPDGQMLFVHTSEESLWIYDATTLEARKLIPNVRTVQSFLRDRIFVVTSDNTLTIYDAATLEAQSTFSGVEHVIPTPVNDWLLVWQDGVQSIRRKDDFAQVMLDELTSALFSPDGRWLLTLDTVGEYTLYDAGTLTATSVEFSFDEPIHNLRWSDNSEQMTQITPTGQVYVWEVSSGRQLRHFDSSGTDVFENNDYAYWSWSPDGAYILNYAYDGNAAIWNFSTGELIATFTNSLDSGYPYYLFFWTPDSQHLFQCNHAGDSFGCNFIDVATGETVQQVHLMDYQYTLGLSPDSRYYVWFDGIYDANTLEKAHDLFAEFRTWSPDSRKIVIQGMWGSSVGVFNLETGDMQDIADPEIPGRLGGKKAVWSPDSTRFVTWVDDGRIIMLWDAETGNLLATTDAHAEVGGISAMSSDGTLLAVGDVAGRLYIRDAATDTLLHTIQAHAFEMSKMLWQPNGRLLATTTMVGSVGSYTDPPDRMLIHIWDGVTGELVDTIEHRNRDGALIWSPSGDRLVTTDTIDVYVWDAVSRTQTGNYPVHYQRSLTTSLEWSTNGNFLLQRIRSGSHGAYHYEVRDGSTFELVMRWLGMLNSYKYTWTAGDEKMIAAQPYCPGYAPYEPGSCKISFLVLFDTTQPLLDVIWFDDHLRLYEFGVFDSSPTTTWSADAERLLAFADNTAQIWQVGEEAATLLHTFEDVERADWNENGTYLLLSQNNQTTIVDTVTWESVIAPITDEGIYWNGNRACFCETIICNYPGRNPYQERLARNMAPACILLPNE